MRLPFLALLLACTPVTDPGADDTSVADTDADTDTADTDTADTDTADTDTADTADTGEPCALGLPCNPIPLGASGTDARDTTEAPGDAVDAWPCAPATDESGPEFFYAVTVPEPGILTVQVDSAAGVDVDVHLLTDLDPSSCRARAHEALAWPVEAGTVYVVVDTWTDLAGAYTLTVDLRVTDGTPCAMTPTDLRMYWSACSPGIDCRMEATPVLRTPAFGPVVGEAHLVTTADAALLTGGWPDSLTDGIAAHYALSEDATGYVMDRDQPWAPNGEGNSHYGQGATGAPVPVEDEAFYVNMYWRDRPVKGTRMLAIEPFSGRAVVLSAGYETGPGSNTAIGGVAEEVHHHLGTDHRDRFLLGFAADQGLALGPVECW